MINIDWVKKNEKKARTGNRDRLHSVHTEKSMRNRNLSRGESTAVTGPIEWNNYVAPNNNVGSV